MDASVGRRDLRSRHRDGGWRHPLQHAPDQGRRGLIAEPGEPRREFIWARRVAQIAVGQDGAQQQVILQSIGRLRSFGQRTAGLQGENPADLGRIGQ
jgi:hypothetical protein